MPTESQKDRTNRVVMKNKIKEKMGENFPGLAKHKNKNNNNEHTPNGSRSKENSKQGKPKEIYAQIHHNQTAENPWWRKIIESSKIKMTYYRGTTCNWGFLIRNHEKKEEMVE